LKSTFFANAQSDTNCLADYLEINPVGLLLNNETCVHFCGISEQREWKRSAIDTAVQLAHAI